MQMSTINCPLCESPVMDIPRIEMQGTPVLCDDCLEVSMWDNGSLRKLTEQELTEFASSPAMELVNRVRSARAVTQ